MSAAYNRYLNKAQVIRLAEQGLTSDEIAEKLGTSAKRVRNFCKNHDITYAGRHSIWTPERIAQAVQLRAEGKNYDEVAAAIGCSRGAVIGKLHDLKVRKRMEAASAAASRTVLPFKPIRLTDPPSPAMVRLAEFDPVVKRALNRRLGIVDPSTDPS